MPYFLNHKLGPAFVGGISTNVAPSSSGVMSVWRETSFRTKAPQGLGTKEIPLSVAEPWTWHESYETLKARNFERQHPGTAFARDRGHVWSSEKYDYLSQPLVGSVRYSSSQTDFIRAYPNITNRERTLGGMKYWYELPALDGLTAYGAAAYTQASPLSAEFSLPAFVGELREGLPSLIPIVFMKNTASWSDSVRGRIRDAKNAGGDYLNVQFGWIPLVNDVISLATALAKATVALTAMGEVHRWRALPTIDTTSMFDAGWVGDYSFTPVFPSMPGLDVPTGPVGSSAVGASKTVIQNLKSDSWFEGSFVRLPKASLGLDQHMDRFEWLINTDLTPADLWQIAPWSWLVDWFVDIGGLIDAFQTGTSNRILSTYAYAMREEVFTTTILLRNVGAGTPWNGPKDYSCVFSAKRKRRIKANPFGFILNPAASLDVGQQLILGALGLTKIK